MTRFTEEVRLDVMTPFRVTSGYALIEGEVTLLILAGGIWPGLMALPLWVDQLAAPEGVRIVGTTEAYVPVALFEAAVAALEVQVLDRAPSASAVVTLPEALDQPRPLTGLEISRMLDVSRETVARGLSQAKARTGGVS